AGAERPGGLGAGGAVAAAQAPGRLAGLGISSTADAPAQARKRHGRTSRSMRATDPSASSQTRSSAKRMPIVWTDRQRGNSSAQGGGLRRNARPIRRSRKLVATRISTPDEARSEARLAPHADV